MQRGKENNSRNSMLIGCPHGRAAIHHARVEKAAWPYRDPKYFMKFLEMFYKIPNILRNSEIYFQNSRIFFEKQKIFCKIRKNFVKIRKKIAKNQKIS